MTQKNITVGSFPTVPSDIPDLDIISRGDVFYMVSTTMNLCPGVPIMKSTDLVHWQLVNYVYDTFENDDLTNLENGKHMYSHGSWAASLKYDEASGLYYIAFCSNDHGFYIYTCDDLENGTFKKHFTAKSFHDPALFIENGKIYVLTGSGGICRLQELALEDDKVIPLGEQKIIFTSDNWGLWEGSHCYHIGDYYYVFIIASPKDRWMRSEVCYRSKDLTSGTWEELTLLQSGIGGVPSGLAQGGIVQASTGDWYGFLFQDMGSGGRMPSVFNVRFENDWPVFGVINDGCFNMISTGTSSCDIALPEDMNGNYFTADDDFDYSENKLALVWQWNHNPVNDFWSVTDRKGFLRITCDRIVSNLCEAHNCLTQRTVYPCCESEVKLIPTAMKPGDYAGLAVVADHYAMVGVMCDENNKLRIFQADSEFRTAFEKENEILDFDGLNSDSLYFKIRYDLIKGIASFLYSTDGQNFTSIGREKNMAFSIYTTFMGARSWLFNYSTKEAGGYVDFDYYKIK